MKREFYVPRLELEGFLVRLSWSDMHGHRPDRPSSVDIEIYDITSTSMDGTQAFYGEEHTPEPKVPLIRGFIKGDGCMQIGFTDEGYHMHFDQDRHVDQLFRVISEARRAALEVCAWE